MARSRELDVDKLAEQFSEFLRSQLMIAEIIALCATCYFILSLVNMAGGAT